MEENLSGLIRCAFSLEHKDIRTYSPLTLAYLGDAVYEIIIRTMLVERGNALVNTLNKKASNLVKASAQKEMYYAIEDKLSEEEINVFKRGRNAKSFTSAKNATMSDYRTATGLETLVGYLYLLGKEERIIELMKEGFKKL